jgi:hypothetical protein
MKSYKEQNNKAKEVRQSHDGPEEIKGHPKRHKHIPDVHWVIEFFSPFMCKGHDTNWFVMHKYDTEEHACKQLEKMSRSVYGSIPENFRIRRVG